MNTSYHEYCIQIFLAGKVLHLPWFFATLLPFTWVLIKMIINLVTHWSKHFWTFIILLFQCSTLYCAAQRLVSLYYWWYYPWEPLFQRSSWSAMTPTRSVFAVYLLKITCTNIPVLSWIWCFQYQKGKYVCITVEFLAK